jgi:two-component system C4-dicarboxylate transport sensor histidine kinase DctB
LNQPLMAIGQFAENGAAFLDRGKPDAARENLSRIGALATRAARIIRNLRAFARNEAEPVAKVDLGHVIAQAVEMSEARLANEGITLDWTPPPRPIHVTGGEVRLTQVFVNLIANAADAMVGTQGEKRIRITLEQGARIRATVSDTGPGIDDPERIFEPFYSTKEVSGGDEGMGLGLSISYGLVQSFGGDIRGTNRAPGNDLGGATGGADFTVELDPWQDVEEDT